LLRIVFMGTPDFAVPTLSEIAAARHEIAAVYTQPPRPADRGMAPRKSPVHVFAETLSIPVQVPQSLNDAEAQQVLRDYGANVVVVVAYGLILPRPVLEAARHGCLNLHGSALPRWRGAAPMQRAIMAGDAETAVTIMRMDEGLDTGPVCLKEPIAIPPNMTAGELHDRMAVEGAGLMVRALAALERDSLDCVPQAREGATYASKIKKSECRIDFRGPATAIHNLIRGLSPSPGAWFEAGTSTPPERIKVLRATVVEGDGPPGTVLDNALTIACGGGAIRFLEVQRAGRRPMPASEFLRGFELPPGTRLRHSSNAA
jgi:methionyl-tRNA formyltransferase